MPPAAYAGETWERVWTDVAEAVSDEHGGDLMDVPAPPPLYPHGGVAPISWGEADALTSAWRSIADAAHLSWTPIAIGPPPADVATLVRPDIAAQWWASTAQLARNLDRAGWPVSAFTVQWPAAPAPRTPAEPATGTDLLIIGGIAAAAIGAAVYIARQRRAEKRS